MTARATCRGCGAADPAPVIDLGRQPLANGYVDPDRAAEPEERFPLAVVFCPHCSLVQLAETVDPAKLFADYVYLSSSSDAFVAHAGALARRLIERLGLTAVSRVVEIGSNDGYLLQHYHRHGIPVLGVEPAATIARVAEGRGVATVQEFFTADLARRLRGEGVAADVLHANNVLAHTPDVHDALQGIATLLRPAGRLVVETPYLRELVDHLEFDTIYHEHVFYYSLTSLAGLLAQHDLAVVDVERLPIHGGSLRVHAQRAGVAPEAPCVGDLLAEEKDAGLLDVAYYERFASEVGALGDELRACLESLRAEGKRVAAYGAAAKGTVLLNTFGIGSDIVEFVADRNPLKQGRLMPGQGIPIRPAAALLDEMPDVVLLLVWNFADEVVAQQQAYLERGGRFLVPVPAPRFIP